MQQCRFVRAPTAPSVAGRIRSTTAVSSARRTSIRVATVKMTDSAYAEDIINAYKAVKLASKVCMSVQRTLTESGVVSKADDSPVTIADYAAQAVVAWVLRHHGNSERLSMVAEEDSEDLRTPEGAPLLTRITQNVDTVISTAYPGTSVSEADVLELIDLGNSPGGSTGRHWVLDPIDGTRGFVGLRQYAVCLGLLDKGEAVAGVLGCPNLPRHSMTAEAAGPSKEAGLERPDVGVAFAAVRGCGAYQGPLSSEELPSEQIFAIEPETTAEALFMESYDSRHSDHSVSAAIVQSVAINPQPLRADSQCKYGLLSRGDAQLFLRFPHGGYREKIWDHCAGVVILEEAGGRVTDAKGARLDFSQGRWLDLQGGIIAGAPEVHSKVIKAASSINQTGHL